MSESYIVGLSNKNEAENQQVSSEAPLKTTRQKGSAARPTSHADGQTEASINDSKNISSTQNRPLPIGADDFDRMRTKIERVLRYPWSLKRRGIKGRVELRLMITAQGHLLESGVMQTSGSSELDDLAIEAAKSAAPFDPMTRANQPVDQPIAVHLPIEFR